MKRFLVFTLLVVVALCVSSITFASTNLSLPSEIESYFSVGDSTILDYADLTGHGADDCWFVIIRTKEGTNILYCFKQKENGWDVEFRTSDAVPQVSAPLSMIVDTEGIDYGMNATVEPLLCIYQMNVSNEYPELTLRFALEKRKWNLHSIESYIGYDHMLVQNGVVTFFKSTENLEVAGRVYGTLQRDIRYISLSAIPKTLAEAKKKLTVAPDLPQSAELIVYPATFSGKKKYDVYSAPDKSSIRGANGKARVSTNSWIQVFGTEGDWVLIQYSIDASHYRFGYITKKSLPKKSEVPELAFRYQSVYTINAVNVTDDPLYSRDTLVTLPAGTEVTLLATLGDDAYIEGNAGKQFRGFAPMTSLSKSASTSDSFTAWNGSVREKAEEIVATKFTSEYGINDYYINPNGGSKLHSDPYCRSVHEKYLPLQKIELTDEILQQYSICSVCSSGSQQPSAEEAAVGPELVLPEKELNSITAQWESIYGNYLLWNYKTNADFVEENGTQPDVPYVFNKSLLNCYPDEDAIPAEEIEKMAVPLIASYGSILNEEKLSSYRIIVNAYKKPDMDGTLFSQSGSWIVGVWDESKAQNTAYIYIDSHTGIPSYFRLTQEHISYIGEPGVEPVKDND